MGPKIVTQETFDTVVLQEMLQGDELGRKKRGGGPQSLVSASAACLIPLRENNGRTRRQKGERGQSISKKKRKKEKEMAKSIRGMEKLNSRGKGGGVEGWGMKLSSLAGIRTGRRKKKVFPFGRR